MRRTVAVRVKEGHDAGPNGEASTLNRCQRHMARVVGRRAVEDGEVAAGRRRRSAGGADGGAQKPGFIGRGHGADSWYSSLHRGSAARSLVGGQLVDVGVRGLEFARDEARMMDPTGGMASELAVGPSRSRGSGGAPIMRCQGHVMENQLPCTHSVYQYLDRYFAFVSPDQPIRFLTIPAIISSRMLGGCGLCSR